jgi:lysophospholipase L1-like esterase
MRRSSLLWAALVGPIIGSSYFVQRTYRLNEAIYFYIALVIFALSVLGITVKLAPKNSTFLRSCALTLLIFSLFLPIADLIYLKATYADHELIPAKPVYSFQAAKGDPGGFHTWWKYYAGQWGQARKSLVDEPDPQGILPFVFVPKSSARFFQSEFRINNLRFRGDDFDAEKGNRYRIFALGESPTFSGTLYPDDRPWPDVLQHLIDTRLNCNRPIQVINAGTPEYSLKENLEKVRRDILPLGPDMLVSYHTFNGLSQMEIPIVSPIFPNHTARGSALLGEIEYRAKLNRFKTGVSAQAKEIDAFPIEKVMNSGLAKMYRELLEMGRRHHFLVVLANFSMAVTADSPDEVKDFYAGVFTHLKAMIAHVSAHNKMVKEIASRAHVPFIDTTPHFAGNWDSDLFLDPVHFTQKGSDLFAHRILDGLMPLLTSSENIDCSARN